MTAGPSPVAVPPTRVAVIGAGHVGATFAYTLELSGLAAEIVLVDLDRDRAAGEAMDLGHAVPFSHPTRIWAGDYTDCASAATSTPCCSCPIWSAVRTGSRTFT